MSLTQIVLANTDVGSTFSASWSPSVVGTQGAGGGQSFLPSESADLAAVQFRLSKPAGATISGRAVCQIFIATGSPGLIIGAGSPVAVSSPVDLSTIPDTPSLVTFPFSTPFTLQSNVVYVAVMFIFSIVGSLNQWGIRPAPNPTFNGSNLVDLFAWTTFTGAYNMVVLGTRPTGNVVLTVRTLFADGSAAVPVRVTVTNTGLALSLSHTSAFGPGGTNVTFTVPTGLGYQITLDYTDCAGASQHVVSPLFDVFSDTCVATGGGPFPPPSFCITFVNFFLTKPLPPPGSNAELVERQAFPDFHHFSFSKDGPVDTIFALMANTGTSPVCAIIQFTFTLPDGSIQNWFGVVNFVNNLGLVTDFPVIQPGVERQVAFSFMPTLLGNYIVDVTVDWDVALPGVRFQSAIKRITFDVVA